MWVEHGRSRSEMRTNRKLADMFERPRQGGMRRLLSKVAEKLPDSGAFLPWKECHEQ
jgi:hypothetical protein